MSSLIVEVCEIKDIQPHPNADRLDIATVKGWNCIIQKGSYEIGDWVVFFPPDCVLPDYLIEKYELEFLKKGGRVGTLKLRGYISQGLVLPVDCVLLKSRGGFVVGDNVADVLGVTKYEVPEKLDTRQGKTTTRKVQNPYFTKYTDIENVKNFDTVFEEEDMVVITEKIHGSNIRFGWLPIEINFKNGDWLGILRSLWKKYVLRQSYEFVYGSHNVQLQWDSQKNFYSENIYAKVISQKVEIDSLPRGYIFYGEVFGKGVQELEYDRDGLDLAIFDIKNSDGRYLTYSNLVLSCQNHNLPIVPELYVGAYFEDILKEHTEDDSTIASHIREGCVVKSLWESNHLRIGRKILKSINPEYLARKNRTEFK